MIRLTETDSTSNYLIALSQKEKLEEFTVVTADFQTAGKGQRGNSWEAERGKNLLFSFVMYPHFLPAREQFLLSKMVSLAIKGALDCYAADISIKWPNDIYWKDKKICGILLENDLLGATIEKSIAGIGININQASFHSPAPNPVSLRQITGKDHSITTILTSVMEKVQLYYQALKEGEKETINTHYHQALFRKDGFHAYSDKEGIFQARILEVKDTGILVLEDSEGMKREYAFKEVAIK